MPASDGSTRQDIEDLLRIMSRLRGPDGCPWDKSQNFASIAPYTIEEAYEVADAIATGDMAALKDELGDLLLQVVYHAQMADETGAFGFSDVVGAICDKMIRRHPHVFGPDPQTSSDAPTPAATDHGSNWEAIKAAERNAAHDHAAPAGTLDAIPQALPALMRAEKLQKRAARVGFDWPTVTPVLEKIREETEELEAAIAQAAKTRNTAKPPQTDAMAEEVGDLLFAVVNAARHLKINPEQAARNANRKFEMRFRYIETALRKANRSVEEASLEEMEALWQQAKTALAPPR